MSKRVFFLDHDMSQNSYKSGDKWFHKDCEHCDGNCNCVPKCLPCESGYGCICERGIPSCVNEEKHCCRLQCKLE